MTVNRVTLQRDIELCRYTICLIDSDRLQSWSSVIFSNNLCSDQRTRNVVAAMREDRLDKDAITSILNILEAIE